MDSRVWKIDFVYCTVKYSKSNPSHPSRSSIAALILKFLLYYLSPGDGNANYGHSNGDVNGDDNDDGNSDDSGSHNQNGDNRGERLGNSRGCGDGVGSGGGGSDVTKILVDNNKSSYFSYNSQTNILRFGIYINYST